MSVALADAMLDLARAIGEASDELAAARRRREREERSELRPAQHDLGRLGGGAVRLAHVVMPGLLGSAFERVVPVEHWTADGGSAIVRCTCGVETRVPAEDFRGCSCERFFLWRGGSAEDAMRVYRPEPETETEAAA